MKDGYYFVLKLTENEHDAVSYIINEFCEKNFMDMKYYRKLKIGHRPMIREVKVMGNRRRVADFKKFLVDNFIQDFVIENYWEEEKKAKKEFLAKHTTEEINLLENKWGIKIRKAIDK
jgi:hypothetical protein